MCRIAGIASLENPQEARRLVQSMTQSMAHGGPDDEGIYQSENVTLGHRRLSIIDLSSAGHQPMVHPNGNLVLSFNGEVYNFRELRRELEGRGVTFRSHSDTEVIMEAYIAWGPSSFVRFRGIFAFALLDVGASRLMLVRDYPGVKPMYYSAKPGRIVFASEVKSFMRVDHRWDEDPRWRKIFLAFGYLPQPYSTLKDVVALRPGHYLDINLKDVSFREVRYQLDDQDVSRYADERSALDAVRDAVHTAVRRNIIADAPLGVFLSGGIDSSLLTLLSHKDIGDGLVTVSVNFDEAQFDEKPFQDIVLKLTSDKNHQSFRVDEQMLWNSIGSIWQAMDQPTIDGVNSYFVSMAAHNAGLKAVLSGLGADELFGGYASAKRVEWLRYLRGLPAKDFIASIAGRFKRQYQRVNYLSLDNSVGDALFLRGIHSVRSISDILDCSEADVWATLKGIEVQRSVEMKGAHDATALEYDFYMKGQLLKDTDFMSMRFGLEARVPFLDQDLINVACRAMKHHHDHSQPKYLLTKAFEDVIPHEIIHRQKRGFTFPFHVWLAKRLRANNDLLTPQLSKALPVDPFLAGKAHWSQVWSGVVLNQYKTSER